MRILICSYDFYPRIGGTETAGLTLATGLAERGYDITVVTVSPATDEDTATFPFRIVRNPGPLELLRLFKAANLVWHNQVSLRLLWPILLVRRPLVLVHHSPLATDTGPGPRFSALKRMACMLGHNAFVSEAYREAADLPGRVIYNTYDEATFHAWPDVVRDRDVVFLGRLVREKGADILIDALASLAAEGTPLSATIIGSGPEEQALKTQASAHGLAELVEFTGALRGETLARTLARHRLMAMPSRWFEGLPISAVEALACGCVVVGADSGGLPEAIGPCGMVVAKDSAPALAAALTRLTTDATLYESCKAQIPQHLKLFSKSALMDNCERLIREATLSKSAIGGQVNE
ncbi:glycosyltransferase family 4 protein [Bradyrhizobium sp. LHD-71]|uniref:glycosyltransferase family 4 protein n=1 Tax=Bradyrhizobium sp. LHD-71 TaxID=3072141 RepID=UPI00280F55E0|nr:glycosyltransferase family 4 protein [Bradyrhizobium sp. LHD-71]MDQ8729365.1 glycosyltransferase family 4 protein [Bradyrhizobium sp. LHD-71]